jgi:hypothetical protein
MKSARIPQEQFVVESTPEYIFVRAVQNSTSPSARIGGDAPDVAANEILEKRVNVRVPALPGKNARPAIPEGIEPLGEVLAALSDQLGVPVEVVTGLEALPVNPVILNNVTIRTAMDLLIRQWPVPEFGYEFRDGRIIIRGVPRSEP